MPGWWLFKWWTQQGPTFTIAWIVWVIVSITLHELAHGWAAIRKGDRTPAETGHMTWNPLVHMGGMSLIAFAIAGFAWGLMPVSPKRMRGKYALAEVAAAGPTANLGLAAISLLGFCLWTAIADGYWIKSLTVSDPLFTSVQTVFWVGLALNLFLCLFNLVPVPPLDGATILREISPAYRRGRSIRPQRGTTFGLFLLLFLFGAPYVYEVAFELADSVAHAGLRFVIPDSEGKRPHRTAGVERRADVH